MWPREVLSREKGSRWVLFSYARTVIGVLLSEWGIERERLWRDGMHLSPPTELLNIIVDVYDDVYDRWLVSVDGKGMENTARLSDIHVQMRFLRTGRDTEDGEQ